MGWYETVQESLQSAWEIEPTLGPEQAGGLYDHILSVDDALNADGQVKFPFDAQDCRAWAELGDDPGLLQQAGYRYACVQWQDTVVDRLNALADFLASVDSGRAEVVASAADQTENVLNTVRNTTDVALPSAKDKDAVLFGLGFGAALWLAS